MSLTQTLRAPDLIRGLTREAPARGPGRDSLCINPFGQFLWDGALGLYHGVAPGGCALYRPDRELTCADRAAPQGAVAAHIKIQHQNTGLVRRVRRFRSLASARKTAETLAAGLERPIDNSIESKLARFDPHPDLSATAEAGAGFSTQKG